MIERIREGYNELGRSSKAYDQHEGPDELDGAAVVEEVDGGEEHADDGEQVVDEQQLVAEPAHQPDRHYGYD